VTLSATRAIWGTNTQVSDTIELKMPAPKAPDSAMASSTDGKAKNTSIVRIRIVFSQPPT
jgi:hypothetical protein